MIAEMAVQTPADLEQEAPAFLVWAKDLAVETSDDFAEAGERLKEIKSAAKRVADFFRPMKQRADETKKAILDAEKKLALPLAEAEVLTKAAMLEYQRAEEEKRLAEQRRLQAEADERARRERERIEQAAAKQRAIEAEARAKAEAARLAAEQASAAERKKLLAEAEAADRKAAAAVAKQEMQAGAVAAVVAPVVQVPSAAPKVAGINTKKIWKARVVDANLVPREFLIVNQAALDAFARGLKEGARVPGVEFYCETTMAAGGR